MFSIEEKDENPDVTKYLVYRYEMQRGRGGLSIRRRTAATQRGFFGGGAKQAEEPFERLSAYWPLVLMDLRQNLRAVSKAIMVEAAHRACEFQEVAKMKARKDSR